MTKTPNATRQPNYPDQIISDKTQPGAEHAALIAADLRRMEQEARELPGPSPTAGMNLGQRILHVGGRENAAGYIEFGSVAAVRALLSQVLRDLQAASPAPAAVPVLYVSPGQLENHLDPESAEGGRYLPARKTLAGKFTQPLYAEPLAAAPQTPAAVTKPIAVLVREIGEDSYFDHRPVRPGSDEHKAIQKSPQMDYCEVYAAAPAVESPAAVAVPADALESVRVLLRVAKNQSTKAGMAHAIGVVQAEVEKAAARITAAPTQEHATQLAGQGQEDAHVVFTTASPELNDLLRETTFLAGEGANMDDAMLWHESLERVLALLAAPAAPAQAQEDARDALTLADQAWNFDSSAYESTRKANAEMLCKLQDCAQTIRSQHARIESQRAELVAEAARTLPAPDNVRAGEPYDNPAFEDLARTMGVWGTAQAALCAQFFLAGRALPARGVDTMLDTPAGMEPVAWLASYQDRGGNEASYTTTHHALAVENDANGTPQALYTAAQVLAMGRVPPATKVSRAHEFRPNKKYPWFCADCGYAPHDELMHTAAPRPPAAQEGA